MLLVEMKLNAELNQFGTNEYKLDHSITTELRN